ncbi:hypothetical protein PIROE2DRAFT_12485 [Piromyces sp. E2]|nr:hypothetical protein PIROE2DRAFT_12485 [Piromyces sp. E2]|eukprot:OUM61488.1 hypothetical protein PIROE2DRAFT_12485 [Piromyces sp. E2]
MVELKSKVLYSTYALIKYIQIEENTNSKNNNIISDFKLLNFTYILIVLKVTVTILFICATYTKPEDERNFKPISLFAFSLILSLYFIKVVKDVSVVLIYVVYHQYVDKEKVSLKYGIIIAMVIFAICAIYIYYTKLIDNYYNQIKMEERTVEGSRNLEANVSYTNEIKKIKS